MTSDTVRVAHDEADCALVAKPLGDIPRGTVIEITDESYGKDCLCLRIRWDGGAGYVVDSPRDIQRDSRRH